VVLGSKIMMDDTPLLRVKSRRPLRLCVCVYEGRIFRNQPTWRSLPAVQGATRLTLPDPPTLNARTTNSAARDQDAPATTPGILG
jgi:hypothetical protein